jgi:hypothetical protein
VFDRELRAISQPKHHGVAQIGDTPLTSPEGHVYPTGFGYLAWAAANRCANSGDRMDVAWGRVRRRPCSGFECGGHRVLSDPEDQSVLDRLAGVEPRAEQQCGPCDLRTHTALQHPRGAAAGMQAQALEPRIEHGVRSSEPDIGNEGQVQAGAEGAQIGSGAKRFACTGNDDGVHAVIASARSIAARNAPDIASVTALRRSGSLTVMSATRSVTV